MNKTALRHAWENLHEAEAAFERLRGARSLSEMERSWATFLSAAGTFFNKLESGAKGYPKTESWLGPIRRERKTDPLLVYVHHARNSREHGMTEITTRQPSRIGIKGDMYVEHLTIGPGGMRGVVRTINPKRPPRVHFERADVKLIRVVDRGQAYDPPSTHLGAAVDAHSPVRVAAALLAYLSRIAKEAGGYAV